MDRSSDDPGRTRHSHRVPPAHHLAGVGAVRTRRRESLYGRYFRRRGLGGRRGTRTLCGPAPAETVRALQILLIMLATPILCLAAVLVDHRRARSALGKRVHELRESEALKSAILNSLNPAVAVLGRDGRIIDLGSNWFRGSGQGRGTGGGRAGLGDNFLEAWGQTASVWMPGAAKITASILEVLHGARHDFSFEYPCQSGAGERWFAVSIVRLDRPESGAVCRVPTSPRGKAAELDIERSRQELTHFMRVFMAGEMTASFAHELNQPLTGILTNARAACSFSTPPRQT